TTGKSSANGIRRLIHYGKIFSKWDSSPYPPRVNLQQMGFVALFTTGKSSANGIRRLIHYG
ncbi:MAG: hypothetical protein KDA87_26920, partial [Planctomycetales bacterium]|nr:hypothetical protein [Planctomycetales bacterium]